MRIDEAIKLLKTPDWERDWGTDPKIQEAARLGKEALERVLAYKKAHRGLHYTPLPSETEE